jgi:hypothetical protein
MKGNDTRPMAWLWLMLMFLCNPALGGSRSLATGAIRATVQPPAALMKREQAAAQTLDRMASLESQAQASIDAAQAVSEAGRDSERRLQAQRAADQRLRATLQSAEACPRELRTSLAGIDRAIAIADQALGRSHAAVQTIAQASGPLLASAAQAADAAFAQRDAAESALQHALETLEHTERRCSQLAATARWDQQDNEASARQLAGQARRLLEGRQTAVTRWQRTRAAFAAAAQAQQLATPTARPARAADRAAIALAQALTEPIQPPATDAPLAAAALDSLAPLWATLTRLQDASTYIGTQLAAGDCAAAACEAFSAEQQELARRTEVARQRWDHTADQWRQTPEVLNTTLDHTRTRQAKLARSVDTLAASLGPAIAQSRNEAQAIADSAQPLLRAARSAHARAQREWEAAYRLAYGADPVHIDRAFSIASGSEPMSAAPPSAMISAPDIRDHAFDLFSAFDGEIEGFGAYTYVLVKSAADMRSPPVRRRFERLLAALQALPRAASVDTDLTRHFNVFCVPVVPGSEQATGPEAVQYASDLGQQLKMRAQSGLLTQAAVRHRLGNSPGPFLITLPTRLSQAQSSTPVLIADLSSYAEDAIADLAAHYMNGLVDDFPSQQALWKPPVLQRVALFMIHMAEGTGQLITSAMPTAQAATTPP